jgi:hypothetical protein
VPDKYWEANLRVRGTLVARLKHRLTRHGAAACDYRVLPLSAVGANSEDVAFKAIWGNVRMRLLHLRNAGRLQSAMLWRCLGGCDQLDGEERCKECD